MEKKIICCLACGEPIKDIVIVKSINFDDIDGYICMNSSCERVGLISTAYKTK